MGYLPISNYGVIGDMNTVALVGLNGSIDFMCAPRFDSPSVFAALLDEHKGGYFKIAPLLKQSNNKQMYIPDTNVLLTRFLSNEGVSEITDLMPVNESTGGNVLIRRVSAIRGEIKYRVICAPRFNYAMSDHVIEESEGAVTFKSDGFSLRLVSNIKLTQKDNDIDTEFILKQGQSADFILEFPQDSIPSYDIQKFVDDEIYRTMEFWKNWIENSTYNGRWREIVNRSALVLKLLTSREFGSTIASPTFGLPEYIGGERNWDYRYCWIRDASFSVYALINLGYKKEARSFIKWVEKQCKDIGHAGYLGLMYTLEGTAVHDEKILQQFEGYKKSSPVRIGNNAHKQLQLDIYGELVDSVYLYNKFVEPITYDFWSDLKDQINWLKDNWEQKDEGIWEVRGGKRHFLYSRLMCWVAFDRMIRIARLRSFPFPEEWKKTRDKIFLSIYDDFWNEERQAFVQFKGADSVDAATLLLPLMRFISPRDKRWLSTLKAIEEELVSDSLVYRYRHKEVKYDPIKTGEGTFSMCTFWFIECLCKSGQLHKARFYFEKMLGYANHLGLYAEELSFNGEHLGNFPQAFTHLGLISAAISLDRHFKDERNKGGEEAPFFREY